MAAGLAAATTSTPATQASATTSATASAATAAASHQLVEQCGGAALWQGALKGQGYAHGQGHHTCHRTGQHQAESSQGAV